MSYTIQYTRSRSPGKVIRQGTEPKTTSDWKVYCWFVLPNGEKHTHSTTAKGQSSTTLIPWLSTLIDSLACDLGSQVVSAGWTCTTHGKCAGGRRPSRRK